MLTRKLLDTADILRKNWVSRLLAPEDYARSRKGPGCARHAVS
jgi:hypothetical protein